MPIIPTLNDRTISPVRAESADIGGAVSRVGQAVSKAATFARGVEAKIALARENRKLNTASTEAVRQSTQLEDELSADPGSFESWGDVHRDAMVKMRSDLSESLDSPATRDLFNQQFDTIEVHSETRVRRKARGLEIDAGRAALSAMEDTLSANYAQLPDSVDRGMILEGVDAAYERAVETGTVTAEEAVQRQQSFIDTAERQRVLADITLDPAAVIDALGQGGYALDEDDRRTSLRLAHKAVAAVETQKVKDRATLAKQASIDRAWEYASLMDLGETNQLQTTAVEAFKFKHAGTQEGAREWLQLRNRYRESADEVISYNLITQALEGTAFVSPANPKHREAADAMYKQLATRWEIEDIPTKATWFSAQIGFVPDTLRDSIIGPLGVMHNPDATALAADIFSKMIATNPGLIHSFQKNHIEKAVEIQSYVEGGMKPKAAIDLFNSVRDIQPAVRDARDREFTTLVRDGDFESKLDTAVGKVFGSDFFFDLDVPPAMVAQVEKVARDNYLLHGNAEAAIAQAATVARGRWSASLTDEDTAQLDAPGIWYPVLTKDDDANRKWQMEQLMGDMDDDPVTRAQVLEVGGKLIVTAHPNRRAAGGRPIYAISGISKIDGRIVHIENWAPDYQRSEQFKRDTKDHADLTQQLYRERLEFEATEGRKHVSKPSDTFYTDTFKTEVQKSLGNPAFGLGVSEAP